MRALLSHNDLDEILIPETLEHLILNETSRFIIKSLAKNQPISTIAREMSQLWEVKESDAEVDIAEFISSLKYYNIDPYGLKSHSDWSLRTPIVHIIQSCNSPCKMCECWKAPRNSYHSAQVLRPFWHQLRELGAQSVMVSGGEPLLHPELREIITDIKSQGLQLMLNSNGTKLDQNNWLTEAGVDVLVVSMDGVDSSSYKSMRGIDAYEKVWANLKQFKKCSPQTEVGLRVTVSRANFSKLDQIIQRAKEAGLDSVGFSPADFDSDSFSRGTFGNVNKIELKNMLLPAVEEIMDFLRVFVPGNSCFNSLEEYQSQGLSQWGPNELRRCLAHYVQMQKGNSPYNSKACLFPTVSMLLDYNGDYRACFYSKPFGNLYTGKISSELRDQTIEELQRSNKCRTCRGKVFCDIAKVSET